jgi:hypothetical protein
MSRKGWAPIPKCSTILHGIKVKQLLLCFLLAAIVRARAVLQYTVRRKLQRWLWLAAVIRDSWLEFKNKQD